MISPVFPPLFSTAFVWTRAALIGAVAGLVTHLAAQEMYPLSISPVADDQIELFWPYSSDEMLLQAAQNFDAWSLIFPRLETVGDSWRTRVEQDGSSQFFRLQQNPNATFTFGRTMGLVLNRDHQSLPFAWVDGLGIADANGVITGNWPDDAPGWLTVFAEGYLPMPVSASVSPDGIGVFNAWLTPFTTSAFLHSSDSKTLQTDPSSATGLIFRIEGSQLASTPALVGAAEIDLVSIGPRWARLDTEGDYDLVQAFALHACSASGASVNLAPEANLAVDVRDSYGSQEAPLLARFDPATGMWMSQEINTCVRAAPGHLDCTLDQGGLYGLFRRPPPEPTFRLRSAAASGSGDSSLSADVQAALADLAANLAQGQKEKEATGEVSAETMQQQLEAVAALVVAATTYADANQDESGKMHLLAAANACNLLGYNDLAELVQQEMEDLVNDLGEDLASEGDCGRIREMLSVANQMAMLGGDPGIQSKLMDKIQSMASDCDVWIGYIHFWFFVDDHPLVGSQYQLASASGGWGETLEVKMATHPGTHQVTGEITGTVRFPSVYYKTDSDCEVSVEYYGLPGMNNVYLQFGGTYDGITFNLNDVTPGGTTSPMSIVQSYVVEVEEEEEQCKPLEGFPQEAVFPDFYYSALVHGLGSSPLITLQEMFENGEHGMGLSETIGGNETFTVGENAYAYPFSEGVVIWSFSHVKKVLPLETP